MHDGMLHGTTAYIVPPTLHHHCLIQHTTIPTTQVALSAPISISRLICEQARSYPNMIEPLMDAVKFFSPLAFDVLTFVLIDELASNASGKIKDDGISTADWLTNLAIFTGMLCKKYPGPMEVHAILQYVVNQLKCWQSMDLLVLERVITSMTGFTLLTDVSEVQCEALAGGQLLQQLTFNYKEAISAKAQAKGATRLMAALQQVCGGGGGSGFGVCENVCVCV